jgi:hypothetical protein
MTGCYTGVAEKSFYDFLAYAANYVLGFKTSRCFVSMKLINLPREPDFSALRSCVWSRTFACEFSEK